jgi:hypothetical protein
MSSLNPISNENLIFRYKFSLEITNEMFQFAKIHQYDDRKSFKEAWDIWVKDYEELITNEIRRLTNLGYERDILDKMFKSTRYYFRKKKLEKKESVARRNYICLNKSFLNIIDEHIKENLNNEKDSYKPSEGFNEFCKSNVDLLKIEIKNLFLNGITNKDEIKMKMKKTYKNRYFIIINK